MTPSPFDWHPHPEVWALCAGLLVAYFGAIRRYGPLFHPKSDDPAATARQQAAFVGGVAVLWIAGASPLHDIGEHYLFSAHMVQHLLEVFIAPPLLLLGIPAWMGQLLIKPKAIGAVVRRGSRWFPAALIFNLALMALHVPAAINLQVNNDVAHGAVHIVLVSVALLMWMPVLSPIPEIRRLPLPGQMGYLFLQTLLPTIPASFLTFGETPLYPIYETFPRLWGMTPLDDMQIAGLIMKIGAGFFIWILITVLFFKWSSLEDREPGQFERSTAAGAGPPAATSDTAPPTSQRS